MNRALTTRSRRTPALRYCRLCVLPAGHISGLQVMIRALATDSEPVHAAFDTETVTVLAEKLRPHVSLVPTQLRRLLAAGMDLSLFGTILLGGAAAEPSLLEAARYLNPTPTHTAYIGANVGDIQAAKAANQTVPFSAIGCLLNAPDRTALSSAFEDHKVDMILGHPNHLKELILG